MRLHVSKVDSNCPPLNEMTVGKGWKRVCLSNRDNIINRIDSDEGINANACHQRQF